jgi:serine/threonine-protein kinase
LGRALARQGRFAESLAALKRGHDLGAKQPGWHDPSAQWVRQAEATVALEAKVPALLQGEFQPRDNQERLDLAHVCQLKKFHHTATGLYAAAFAADPKLADDLQAEHRYDPACYAALAAAGQGVDVGKLDDKEGTRLRQQALDWLRADLGLWNKQLASGPPGDRPTVQLKMRHWQKDSDLAGIRDPAALANMPPEEQKGFAQLWADVAALCRRPRRRRGRRPNHERTPRSQPHLRCPLDSARRARRRPGCRLRQAAVGTTFQPGRLAAAAARHRSTCSPWALSVNLNAGL